MGISAHRASLLTGGNRLGMELVNKLIELQFLASGMAIWKV